MHVKKALSRAPENRFQDVSDFALVIRQWMDGTQKRQKALKIVQQAKQQDVHIISLREETKRLEIEAKQQLSLVEGWEPEEKKIAGWQKIELARANREQIEFLILKREQLLQAALTHKSDLPEAHESLARHYRSLHEQEQDSLSQRKLEFKLLLHAQALPEQHSARLLHISYIKGNGAISLITQPAGADIWLEEYVQQNRRTIATNRRFLGQSSLKKYPVPMGSYRLIIKKEGFHEVIYPIHIGRLEHWDGKHPNDESSQEIWLPPLGTLDKEDCYIPQGWFYSGGDPNLPTSLPYRKIWINSLILKKFPVRNKEYIQFLNDLIQEGEEEKALLYAPRERSSQNLKSGALFFPRSEEGFFRLPKPARNNHLDQYPVYLIDWHSANAYAAAWLRFQVALFLLLKI